MPNVKKQGLFIGRFQPVHEGHIYAIKVAASQVGTLKILVGSVNACRSIKNPWTYEERVAKIRKVLWQEGMSNIKFYPVNDYPYNDHRWITEVISIAYHAGGYFSDKDTTLFGHEKEGNDYLKWFPMWKFQSVPSGGNINATKIRENMFHVRHPDMPKTVQADWDYYQAEAEKFSGYPYPETLNFNCADAVVTCLGHVLLIQRKHTPGMGAWALPGGFKNRNETFQECALRELREETNLRVPEKVLIGSIMSFRMFDSPVRSFGINRNTMAYHFDIAPDKDGSLPRANGSDDASEAVWIPMHEAMKMSLYDDHGSIISELTGIYPDFAFVED
jgi:bifunctional NMN adenylyltransferase/nudix hydrolase